MPKKATAPMWDEKYNTKLFNLIRIGAVDPRQANKPYINDIHQKYFPDFDRKKFGNNFRRKTATWLVDEGVRNKRKQKGEIHFV